MDETTKISWADHTGNPWVGCTVAHTGCTNCYARDFSQRKHGSHGAKASRPWALWGPGQDRYVTKGFWTDAPKWARAAARDGVRRTIFPSLMDPLDAEVYERAEAPPGVACRATFDRFMQTIRETAVIGINGRPLVADAVSVGVWFGDCLSSGPTRRPGLTYLLLTKRPENWRWIPEDVRPYCWLLYSASDQPSLDAGVGDLLSAEGFAGLGLSLEPLVGPLDLASPYTAGLFNRLMAQDQALGYTGARTVEDALPGLRWVIIGGESGRNARPCDVAWIRSIVRQCRDAGVAPYVKQAGANVVDSACSSAMGLPAPYPSGTRGAPGSPDRILFRHPAGADPSEWPSDVRVQEFPEGLR